MKAIDFTHPGGFPLTQDQLDYLQQAYTECLNAFAVMGGTGPVTINGMGVSVAGGTTTIADGWFFYNDELIKFNAGSYTTVPPGFDVLVDITPTAGTLTYNDGSIFGAVLNKTATIILAPTAVTATQFPYSMIQPFHIVFGRNGRESTWNSLAVSTPVASGGVTGTIFYKKNFLNNTLQIRGFLTAGNAQNFNASPGALFYSMGALPGIYTPANNTYFTADYFLGSLIKDDLGIGWIKHVSCGVNVGGQFLVNWIRPDIAITGYTINFNTIIPLD
jgi:hypothetical protein